MKTSRLSSLCGLYALIAAGPLHGQDARSLRTTIDGEVTRLIALIEQAEGRYRSELIGKVKNRAGKPLPENALMRPLLRRKNKVKLGRDRVAGLYGRLGKTLSAKDFGRRVDEIYRGAIKAAWEVLLDEARRNVELLRQEYNEKIGVLRDRLAGGGKEAKARVKASEARFHERIAGRFQRVSSRLATSHRDFLQRIRGWSDAAKRAGRDHAPDMMKRLVEEDFAIDPEAEFPSGLQTTLETLRLSLVSVVGAQAKELDLAEALRAPAETTPSKAKEITLAVETYHFDGERSEDPRVSVGGMIILHANLYPSDARVAKGRIEIERNRRVISRKDVPLPRVRDHAFDFRTQPIRVLTDVDRYPEFVVRGRDPAGNRKIVARVGDRILFRHRDRVQPVTVTEPQPRMRYVRIVDGRAVAARPPLRFGVRYKVEVRYPFYRQENDLKCTMEWGPRDQDREDVLLLAVGGDARNGYLLFRSTRFFVLEDRRR